MTQNHKFHEEEMADRLFRDWQGRRRSESETKQSDMVSDVDYNTLASMFPLSGKYDGDIKDFQELKPAEESHTGLHDLLGLITAVVLLVLILLLLLYGCRDAIAGSPRIFQVEEVYS